MLIDANRLSLFVLHTSKTFKFYSHFDFELEDRVPGLVLVEILYCVEKF